MCILIIKKYIMILGRDSIDGLDQTTLTVDGVEIHKFKEKHSEINSTPLGLGNVSKVF